jgi:hypothetical protein
MRYAVTTISLICMAVLTAASPLAKREDGVCVATDPQVCNVGGTYHLCDDVSLLL